MQHTRPYWKIVLSLLFNIIATLLVLVAGAGAIRFFVPFVIGWIISCIANPLVCWLDAKLKIKKKFDSALIIVVVIAAVMTLLYLIVWLLLKEVGRWIVSLPVLLDSMSVELQALAEKLNDIFEMLPKSVRNAGAGLVAQMSALLGNVAATLGEPTVSLAGDLAKQIPAVIIGIFMVILSAYFFVADREFVLSWFEKSIPKPVYHRLSMAVSHFKLAVGGYFVAQFKIMAVVSSILFIGLSLLKVEYAIVLSVLIGFLDFLPFFGTGTAFVPWCLYTVLTGDYMRALCLLLLYITTQVVRQLIQPKLVGDEVGLQPLPTLLLIYIGYRLGGFLWMILSVPIGMILVNMYQAGAFDYLLDDVRLLIEGIKKLKE